MRTRTNLSESVVKGYIDRFLHRYFHYLNMLAAFAVENLQDIPEECLRKKCENGDYTKEDIAKKRDMALTQARHEKYNVYEAINPLGCTKFVIETEDDNADGRNVQLVGIREDETETVFFDYREDREKLSEKTIKAIENHFDYYSSVETEPKNVFADVYTFTISHIASVPIEFEIEASDWKKVCTEIKENPEKYLSKEDVISKGKYHYN